MPCRPDILRILGAAGDSDRAHSVSQRARSGYVCRHALCAGAGGCGGPLFGRPNPALVDNNVLDVRISGIRRCSVYYVHLAHKQP